MIQRKKETIPHLKVCQMSDATSISMLVLWHSTPTGTLSDFVMLLLAPLD
jgi:hypothetical protein